MRDIDTNKLEHLKAKADELLPGQSFLISVDFIQQCFNTTWGNGVAKRTWFENFEYWALVKRLTISEKDKYTYIISR
jgi:uncharacterized membrane protein YcfT